MLAPLLWLLSLGYSAAVAARSALYDAGILHSFKCNIPVVCIGNLSAGGAGKSPHTLWVAQHLASQGYAVAVLSRGYGRSTRGFLAVQPGHGPSQVGDEPCMMAQALQGVARVFVGEDRVAAIGRIQQVWPECQVVVLDDGLQHRRLRPSLAVAAMPWACPPWKDRMLPLGRLREPARAMHRLHAFIVTKVPADASSAEKMEYINLINRRAGGDRPVVFSSNLVCTGVEGQSVVLISGLADNEQFAHAIAQQHQVLRHHDQADHHRYTPQQVLGWLAQQPAPAAYVTTAKDAVKLQALWPGDAPPLVIAQLQLHLQPAHVLGQLVLGHVQAFHQALPLQR